MYMAQPLLLSRILFSFFFLNIPFEKMRSLLLSLYSTRICSIFFFITLSCLQEKTLSWTVLILLVYRFFFQRRQRKREKNWGSLSSCRIVSFFFFLHFKRKHPLQKKITWIKDTHHTQITSLFIIIDFFYFHLFQNFISTIPPNKSLSSLGY